MERNGDVRVARIFDAMQADIVCNKANFNAQLRVAIIFSQITVYVANVVCVHRWAWNLLQLLLIFVAFILIIADVGALRLQRWYQSRFWLLLRPTVLDLRQASLQHLHEAVTVGVVVNGRRLAFVPAKNHQIEPVVTGIDEISCVAGKSGKKVITIRFRSNVAS